MGRIQQKGEMEYEPVVALVTRLKRLREQLAGGSALSWRGSSGSWTKSTGTWLMLHSPPRRGKPFTAVAAELRARGIHERRRFKCWTIDVGSHVEFKLEPIPDQEVSEERNCAIRKNSGNSSTKR